MEDSEFDYEKAMAELEAIAQKVEDLDTRLDEMEKYVKRSDELITGCREYLRTVRHKVEDLDK